MNFEETHLSLSYYCSVATYDHLDEVEGVWKFLVSINPIRRLDVDTSRYDLLGQRIHSPESLWK